MMRAPRGSAEHKRYWGDEAMQARYRSLLAEEQPAAMKGGEASGSQEDSPSDSAAEESQAAEASQMAVDIAEMRGIASDPEIQAGIDKVMDGIARDLVVLEEPEAVDAAMTDWLNALAEGKAPTAGEHHYDLSKWRSAFERQGDFKNVESFATAMHKAGASPEVVDSMLRRFIDLRASVTSGPLSRAIMRKRREKH